MQVSLYNPAETVVGRTTVLRKADDTKVEIVFQQATARNGAALFEAYLPQDENRIGFITIDWLRVENGKCKSFICKAENDSSEYPGVEGKINRICILNMMADREEYKGLGTALMQVAMEYGIEKGCEGRAQLDAVRDSHVFHYKMGFRSQLPTQNVKIEAKIKKYEGVNLKDIPYEQLESMLMHLPEEGRLKWLAKIKESPILAAKYG